ELIHGQSLHRHAPPGELFPNPRPPLDAQFVESLFILSCEWVLFYVSAVRLDTLHFEVCEIADYGNFALDSGRVAQQARDQQPSLTIDLHELAVIVGAVQKL